MKRLLRNAAVAVSLTLAVPTAYVFAKPSADNHARESVHAKAHAEIDRGVEALSPELRSLLKKEMLALQEGMKLILPAYISGDLVKVAYIADEMKRSYILKQEITDKQKVELKTKLTRSFLQSDQKFHAYAGMLEHVAEKGHLELVGFYYGKILESCVGCHSEYAITRFPGLLPKPSTEDHHH